jgi:hypothetical protein
MRAITTMKQRRLNRGWFCDTHLRKGRWTLEEYNTLMRTNFSSVEQALRAAQAVRRRAARAEKPGRRAAVRA